MEPITERYADKIAGVLGCFDRLLVTGTLAGFVIPGLIGGAWLQCGEDPHQARLVAALFQNCLDLFSLRKFFLRT